MAKYLSRTFWLLLIAMGLAFALSWHQDEAVYFTTVANVGLGGWIAGKWLQGKQNGA